MIHLDETQVGQLTLLDEMFKRTDTLKELDLIEKLKPSFSKDGNQYCCGENLKLGIVGFGNTASEAMSDFCRAFIMIAKISEERTIYSNGIYKKLST